MLLVFSVLPCGSSNLSAMTTALFESNLRSLRFLHRGKVRDIYEVDAERLLIVQTDRLSAFDVVLPTPVPGKGEVLTALSLFWFRRLAQVIPNHLLDTDPATLVAPAERDQIAGRAMVVRRLKPLAHRGDRAGLRGGVRMEGVSAHRRDLRHPAAGRIAGGRSSCQARSSRRPPKRPPERTTRTSPSAEAERLLGAARAAQVREKAIALYSEAADYARTRGIIIADTKFEFGTDADGNALSDRRGPYARLVALLAGGASIDPAAARPASTSSTCATGSRASAGTRSLLLLRLPSDVLAHTAEKYREASAASDELNVRSSYAGSREAIVV